MLLFRYPQGAFDARCASVTAGGATASVTAWRALEGLLLHVYVDPAADVDETAVALAPIAAALAPVPPLSIARLECRRDIAGAAAGAAAPFHYVVETGVAPGYWNEVVRWYDSEHLPGLAAVPGCVRARRFDVRGDTPRSYACYDLASPAALTHPAWLAVRATRWSDRMRPQFRETVRTMFRAVGGPAGADQ